MNRSRTIKDPLNSDFGSFIRRKRKELDISQEDLADFLGLSQETISEIERGQRIIFLTDFVRFVKRYAPEITIDLPKEVRKQDILCKLKQSLALIGTFIAFLFNHDKTTPFHSIPFLSIPYLK